MKLLLATYRESGSRQERVSSLFMTLVKAESSGGSCAPFPITPTLSLGLNDSVGLEQEITEITEN